MTCNVLRGTLSIYTMTTTASSGMLTVSSLLDIHVFLLYCNFTVNFLLSVLGFVHL